VLEAMSRGTPAVVVRGPDNAAAEFIEEGSNGYVAAASSSEALAAAIVRVHAEGMELRRSTHAWFVSNRQRLSLESSLAIVLATYASTSGVVMHDAL
jgi:glycosyltransferase involved in cell wall biosynthesis